MNVVVIGASNIKNAKCYSWIDFINEAPVVAGEYDLVIYNLPTLDKEALNELDDDKTLLIRRRIAEGIVTRTTTQIVITAYVESGPLTNTLNYEIFPFQLYMAKEYGQKILNKPAHSTYYSKVDSWSHTFQQRVKPIEENPSSVYQWNFYTTTTTGHNKAIGFTIERLLISVSKYHYPATRYGRPATKTEKVGSIMFLPPQTRNTYENEGIEDLIKDLTKDETQEQEYPEFILETKTASETKLTESIDEIVHSLDTQKQRLEELNEELSQYRFKKGILYFDGKSLENAVAEVLKEIGISYDKMEGNEEDGIIHLQNGDLLVEIKGSTGAIPTTKVIGQLMGRCGNYEELKGIKIGAILIANPYRQKKLEERAETFESNLIQTAKLQKIKLIGTVDLFKFWDEFINTGNNKLTKLLEDDTVEIKYT